MHQSPPPYGCRSPFKQFINHNLNVFSVRCSVVDGNGGSVKRNPAIFQKAMLSSNTYNDQFRTHYMLLWASISVKNPAYPDTLYVAPLIGHDTVSTTPDQALQAFIDNSTVSRTIHANMSEAEGIYSALEKLCIDWTYIGTQLEDEGVESFKKSFDSLLNTLQEKANSLKFVSL